MCTEHTRLYPAVRIHHVKDKQIGYYKMTINNRQQKCSAIIWQLYLSESVSSLVLKSFLQHQHKTIMLANKTGILLQNKWIPSKHGWIFSHRISTQNILACFILISHFTAQPHQHVKYKISLHRMNKFNCTTLKFHRMLTSAATFCSNPSNSVNPMQMSASNASFTPWWAGILGWKQ